MNLATVTAIREELEAAIVGRRFGKIFQLTRTDLAIDLRLPDSRYLFVSTQPGKPRTYLITRRLRDLEKSSVNPGPFALVLRKRLSGGEIRSITQVPHERILRLEIEAEDDIGTPAVYTMIIQLTGSSSNILLLDAREYIVDSFKVGKGEGQQVGEKYVPPERRAGGQPAAPAEIPNHANLSAELDDRDQEIAVAERFRSIANSARTKLNREIAKRRKLVTKLNDDLTNHGDAERWKLFGDLLLANVSTAKRNGNRVVLTDYFDPSAPEIEVEVDETDSLTAAAEKYFKKYAKARNAGKEIERRLAQIREELDKLDAKLSELESAIEREDEGELRDIAGEPGPVKTDSKRKRQEAPSGFRTFVSTDGFEILVGKKAKDNDQLTFRIAKSLDTWMHAADYPGSHVVIRNQNRKEIPQRTLLEAAQLAAFYSQGKAQPKAAVHYTQKKFVNKPKGAAPGLVSLASFKTLLVEPQIGDAVMKTE